MFKNIILDFTTGDGYQDARSVRGYSKSRDENVHGAEYKKSRK